MRQAKLVDHAEKRDNCPATRLGVPGMQAETFIRDMLDEIGVVIGGDGPADIHVHDDRMYQRVVRDRELGLGEAFQDGWWSANQLDEFVATVQEANLRDVVRPSVAVLKLMAASRFTNRQTVKRAQKNASAHYDIGNDLYERMLDKRMIYSCGYWRDAATSIPLRKPSST